MAVVEVHILGEERKIDQIFGMKGSDLEPITDLYNIYVKLAHKLDQEESKHSIAQPRLSAQQAKDIIKALESFIRDPKDVDESEEWTETFYEDLDYVDAVCRMGQIVASWLNTTKKYLYYYDVIQKERVGRREQRPSRILAFDTDC